MSGWIKMGVGLRRHPKVVRITAALKTDRLRVVGALHAVWCVFDEHSTDGVLPGYTAGIMDEEIGWRGFSTAMQAVGWLVEDDEGLQVPDYEEHNGATAKRRALDAQGKGKRRKKSAECPALDDDDPGQMSASDADKTRNRIEKIREEEEKTSSLPRREPPEIGAPLGGGEGEDETPEPEAPPTPYGAITQALRKAGVQRCNPGHLTFRALVDAGATADEFLAYVDAALTKRDPFAYLLAVVESARREAKEVGAAVLHGSIAPPNPAAWRDTDRGVRAMAAQLGMTPKATELPHEWVARVSHTWQRKGCPPLLQPTETA